MLIVGTSDPGSAHYRCRLIEVLHLVDSSSSDPAAFVAIFITVIVLRQLRRQPHLHQTLSPPSPYHRVRFLPSRHCHHHFVITAATCHQSLLAAEIAALMPPSHRRHCQPPPPLSLVSSLLPTVVSTAIALRCREMLPYRRCEVPCGALAIEQRGR